MASVQLTVEQKRRLLAILTSAFPTFEALERFAYFHVGTNLDQVSARGPLPTVITALIQRAEATGVQADLIEAANAAAPSHAELRAFTIEIGLAPAPESAIVKDNPALADFLNALQAYCEHLPYIGLCGQKHELTQIYIEQRQHRHVPDEEMALSKSEPRPQIMREALELNRHILLEGSLGMSKSTLLRHLAHDLAAEWIGAGRNSLVPVLVSAAGLATRSGGFGPALHAQVTAQLKRLTTRDLPGHLFSEPPAPGAAWLVMIDALDGRRDESMQVLVALAEDAALEAWARVAAAEAMIELENIEMAFPILLEVATGERIGAGVRGAAVKALVRLVFTDRLMNGSPPSPDLKIMVTRAMIEMGKSSTEMSVPLSQLVDLALTNMGEAGEKAAKFLVESRVPRALGTRTADLCLTWRIRCRACITCCVGGLMRVSCQAG